MRNRGKIFAVILILVFIVSMTACGGSTNGAVKLKVGASPAPHMEILENVKPILLEQGIDLEIVEFTDYLMPNIALEEGDIDANYFQHGPYMEDFNAERDGNLVAAGSIHYEPLGLYPGKSSDLQNVPDGAKIGIPDDATNGGRALLLLEVQGIITLPTDKDFSKLTKYDIIDNPHNVEIIELEAVQIPAQLPDLDFAVINGNYALSSGIVDTVIVTEDENSVAVDYANVIAVKSGNENDDAIIKLVEALKSDVNKEFITSKYGKSVIVYEGE